MLPSPDNRGTKIEFQRCEGYLRAAVSGPSDSIEISLRYWREVAAECRRLGYSRLLVCENLGRTGPSLEYYLVGCDLPGIVMGIRVAFVDVLAEELESNRLGENVAFNRGADVRLFVDEKAAIAWLISPGG